MVFDFQGPGFNGKYPEFFFVSWLNLRGLFTWRLGTPILMEFMGPLWPQWKVSGRSCFVLGCLLGSLVASTLVGSPTYPIGSMGLVYLPTFTIHFFSQMYGKYVSPMDGMGYKWAIPWGEITH